MRRVVGFICGFLLVFGICFMLTGCGVQLAPIKNESVTINSIVLTHDNTLLDKDLKELHFNSYMINELQDKFNKETTEWVECLSGNGSNVEFMKEPSYYNRNSTTVSYKFCDTNYLIHNHPSPHSICYPSEDDIERIIDEDISALGIICDNGIVFFDRYNNQITLYIDDVEQPKRTVDSLFCLNGATADLENWTCNCVIDTQENCAR